MVSADGGDACQRLFRMTDGNAFDIKARMVEALSPCAVSTFSGSVRADRLLSTPSTSALPAVAYSYTTTKARESNQDDVGETLPTFKQRLLRTRDNRAHIEARSFCEHADPPCSRRGQQTR